MFDYHGIRRRWPGCSFGICIEVQVQKLTANLDSNKTRIVLGWRHSWIDACSDMEKKCKRNL